MIRFSAFKSHSIPVLVLCLAFSQTACLKTRAQLREENDDTSGSAPVAVKQGPQEVHGPAGGGYAIDEMKSEISRLSGRVEDLERAQNQAASKPGTPNADEVKKMENRIIELEQAQANMLEAIKKMQDNPPASNADPAELLKKGKNQVEAGNVEGSIETFGGCIKVAKGKIAEDCLFNRGESYFATKDYKKAIVDYSKFPEKYTRSAYMPRALMKIGLAFEALGMKDDAKGFYQELVEKFPKSPEAKKVRSKVK